MHKQNILDIIKDCDKPITLEKYIDLCLYSENGYYKNSQVIGSRGDFVTAPEISQLFGEIIGLFIFDYWQKNINQFFNLIELGPGKGTLIRDIMNITKTFKNFNESLKLELVEKNIQLIKDQKILLNKDHLNINKIIWSNHFNPQNKNPIIIIANEFFDCFPIRQFQKKDNEWLEKMIYLDNDKKNLKFLDIKINDLETIKQIKGENPNDILEISKVRDDYFSEVCRHISIVGGMMIMIDYGYFEKPINFTLQSMYNNKISHIFDNIGKQDLTALVDFNKLIFLAKSNKLKINIFSSQRDFLIKYGINQRAEKIYSNCSLKEKDVIKKGLDRLTDKENMGSLFKVLVISKE